MRSLRPTGRCRVGDRARSTDRYQDSPKDVSRILESDLAWAPTHTLTNPLTEVVDHSAATSILAAGLGSPEVSRSLATSKLQRPWARSRSRLIHLLQTIIGGIRARHLRRVLLRLRSGDWHHSPESAIRRSPWIPWIPGSWILRRSSITSSVLKTWLKT